MFRRTPEEVALAKLPDTIRLLILFKMREEDKHEANQISFTKLVLASPGMTMGQIYYALFLKIAHYLNPQRLAGEPDVEDSFPRPVDDYEALFNLATSSNAFKTGSVFELGVRGNTYDMNSTEKLADVIRDLGDDPKWDSKQRVLKMESFVDLHNVTQKILGMDYMKKLSSEEVEVRVGSFEEDTGSKNLDIYKLIKDFCTPEILDSNNLYRCTNCKQDVNGLRKIDIYKAPKYLILHMKKLKDSWDRYSTGSNSELMVEFPVENLNMTPFVISREPIECYNIQKETIADANNPKLDKRIMPEFTWKKDQLMYNCFGVINHYGSMHFGHYTAYAKNNGQWYQYDDSHVTKMSDPKDIVRESAYVLFYERIDN